LPSLNKARQAANLIDCQSRLRQMGTCIQMYVTSNKGMLPWGAINHETSWLTADNIPNAGYKETVTWWFFTLSLQMNSRLVAPDWFVRNLSPLFRDKDVIEGNDTRWVNHYTANPRVLYQNERDDAPAILTGYQNPSIQGQDRVQRKMVQVKQPSNVFTIWDGPQAMDQEFNTYGLASSMDAWGMYATSGFCYGTPSPGFNYDRAILPGQLGVSGVQPGKAFQKKYNMDLRQAFNPTDGWLTHLRFRHMGNKRLAALCLDGHVETREVGTVMIKDIFTNPSRFN